MKNTREHKPGGRPRILMIGGPGSGKTTQFRTLPGRTFLYIFDPNAVASLAGADIDYEDFLPDLLDLNIQPLKKTVKGDKVMKAREPMAYVEFEEHLEQAVETGFFDSYDNIGLDSATTFSDAIMDRTMYLNGRLGKMPEQDDWAVQMTTFQNVWRTLVSLDKNIFCTAHEEMRKDEHTGRMYSQPVLTGRLRTRIPLLFSEIFRCESDSRGGKKTFDFHLVGDPTHQYVRTTIRGEKAIVDVTIPEEDWDNPCAYGLGSLFPNLITQGSRASSQSGEVVAPLRTPTNRGETSKQKEEET